MRWAGEKINLGRQWLSLPVSLTGQALQPVKHIYTITNTQIYNLGKIFAGIKPKVMCPKISFPESCRHDDPGELNDKVPPRKMLPNVFSWILISTC